MARKNLIGVSAVSETNNPASHAAPSHPLAGLSPAVRNATPIGGISKSLGNITQQMERAKELERQLTEGQMVIEVDPNLVDSSFIRDRLSIDDAEIEQLAELIREHGQQVPVLLRPHPTNPERFQVAYGHRRLAAVRKLGGKLRAVIRDLSDEGLVVSQGQENNARKDLSFIERALFAARLEDRSFGRQIIMSALAVDKAAVSKMIAIVRSMPEKLIEAIGPAPETGRRRWQDLAELSKTADLDQVYADLGREPALSQTSDERFQIAYARMSATKESVRSGGTIESAIDGLPVTYKVSATYSSLVFDRKGAPGFDDFVRGKLADLYAEYAGFQNVTGD